MKRLQNTVSESRIALPIVSVYAIVIWLLAGLIQENWWIQFAIFAMCTYLMVELNNANALIRIYSRMVSCTFLVLSCMACFMFGSLSGAVLELCIIAAYSTLFHSYQDKKSTGWIYYTFLLLGLSSLVFVHILYYIPVLWLVIAFKIQSLSWRTFFASLLGLLTPYWFAGVYFVYTQDIDTPLAHFAKLNVFESFFDFSQLSVVQIIVYVFMFIMTITGTVHYFRTRYNDKIRIRMLFDCFIIIDLLTFVLLTLQPQHYDMLMRIIIINTSPLLAHFIALTHTRWTNIAFYVISGAAVIITGLSLWMG